MHSRGILSIIGRQLEVKRWHCTMKKILKEQRKFMNEHLLRRVPEYCEEMGKHAATTFYREVAILLREFISSDSEELNGGS